MGAINRRPRSAGWVVLFLLGWPGLLQGQTGQPVLGSPSAAWLSLLPDGEVKRRFVLDCTGCHQFDEQIAMVDGRPRTEAEWVEAVERMLGYAGASSGFPVMAAGRSADATAQWLTRHLQDAPPSSTQVTQASVVSGAIREYRLPAEADLPHDIAIDRLGAAVITGMFTHQMYVLTPETGRVATVAIPRPNANPRAVDIDARGNWWLVLGAPRSLARYEPETEAWSFFDVGVYPHSLALGADAVWYNGHFTYQPELIGSIHPTSGAIESVTVPEHPDEGLAPAGPIPYGLRVAPDRSVWGSELQGNRMIRFDPADRSFEMYSMPESWSGPRRFDIDGDGIVWIPGYASNTLYRLDPGTGTFTAIPLPVRDAVPYIVRVDGGRGTVWIGTAAADAVLSLNRATMEFTVYPTPSRGALIRHMALGRDGDVWLAYGASPGRLPPIVARLQRNGQAAPE